MRSGMMIDILHTGSLVIKSNLIFLLPGIEERLRYPV